MKSAMNQVFSLVLGLVVVVLLLVVLNQRYNIIGRLLPFQDVTTTTRVPTLTPTITPTRSPSFISRLFGKNRGTPTTTPSPTPTQESTGQTSGVVTTPTPISVPPSAKQIPNTGTPTPLIVSSIALAFVGLKLRKYSSRS